MKLLSTKLGLKPPLTIKERIATACLLQVAYFYFLYLHTWGANVPKANHFVPPGPVIPMALCAMLGLMLLLPILKSAPRDYKIRAALLAVMPSLELCLAFVEAIRALVAVA